jgi:elongation factor G
MPDECSRMQSLRNIGIVAHIDAGKTTITERFLYCCGRTHRLGSVDEGTTVTDWMEQERQRGITIVSAAVSAHWHDYQINLIDTPGHIDFTAEVQRALRVLDGSIVVFDAVQGVEPQSETVWRQADRFGVPRICFVNKMDRVGADFPRVVNMIREQLGANALAIQMPLGAESEFEGIIDLLSMTALRWPDESGEPPEPVPIPQSYLERAREARRAIIEAIADSDEEILALYLEGSEPDTGQLVQATRRATIGAQVFPVLCGAALRNKGMQPLLDAVTDFLPCPTDLGEISGRSPDGDKTVTRRISSREPLAALVYKIVSDPYVGRLAYLRVYAGRLASGDTVWNASSGNKLRIGRLVRMYADRREDITEVNAGDIAAAAGLKKTTTGDTLCDPARPLLLEEIAFPEPVVNIAVEPKTAEENERIGHALEMLAEEDPTFRVKVDEDTGQRIISGMGELHLEVLVERLQREHNVTVRTGRPHVTYKETITRSVARAEGRVDQQAGNRGQFAYVVLALEPAATGSGVEFCNSCQADVIPRQYVPAVALGVKQAAASGILGGYAVTDIRVTLVDGGFHDRDSTELAFQIAGGTAFHDGLRAGAPTLLEPLCRLEILAPNDDVGNVMSSLSARRCEIHGTDSRPGGVQSIVGVIPLRETFGFTTELRSSTRGRGTFAMEFDRFASLPGDITEQVLKSGA